MVDKSKTTTGVLGVFTPTTPLRPLIAELQKAGLPDEAIDILSPLPLSEPLLQKPIRLPLYVITIIAGIVGIGVGIFFAGGTAALYPLMTGGKPIVAPPVVGIISFETMMLLAIVTTFIAMVMKIRSAGRSAAGRDPRIDEGAIAISVQIDWDDPRLTSIERIFKEAGAMEVQGPHSSSSAHEEHQGEEKPHPHHPSSPLELREKTRLGASGEGG
ncbi:MAG: quinol:electron acceptor oxidoreductase subunit ActD [Nitrospiraceae bacterium]